ncbi:hypothetical protein DPMN_037631 [Dreissena polymorpha]|uniref:HTH psq-type domain-containing protein n=1 Tax=Dreissena polymorpha TaxID=45954 RepID=A0A9D4MEW0_DREPO|nr:hypothetical protein DPMN_037631 [Dreissena polymorpha]
MTLGQASKTYNIPKTTLADRVYGKYATDHIDAKTVLSADEEQRIAKWVVHMSRVGYGRTRHGLCTVVQKILYDTGRETPFLVNKLGRQPLRGFLKRHPYLFVTTIQLGKERAVITIEII